MGTHAEPHRWPVAMTPALPNADYCRLRILGRRGDSAACADNSSAAGRYPRFLGSLDTPDANAHAADLRRVSREIARLLLHAGVLANVNQFCNCLSQAKSPRGPSGAFSSVSTFELSNLK